MSRPRKPDPVMWFLSVIFSDQRSFEVCLEKIEQKMSPLDYVSKATDFGHTGYYNKEMGDSLLRCFISLKELGDPGELVEFKLFTNDLEMETLGQQGRLVNIDPGYIAMGHLILATGKPTPHRPYLGQGIYADLTLIYQTGQFKALPWTYTDYASDTIRGLLLRLREEYKYKLKNLENGNEGK